LPFLDVIVCYFRIGAFTNETQPGIIPAHHNHDISGQYSASAQRESLIGRIYEKRRRPGVT
jgi:hypothetical protein